MFIDTGIPLHRILEYYYTHKVDFPCSCLVITFCAAVTTGYHEFYIHVEAIANFNTFVLTLSF